MVVQNLVFDVLMSHQTSSWFRVSVELIYIAWYHLMHVKQDINMGGHIMISQYQRYLEVAMEDIAALNYCDPLLDTLHQHLK